jgi:ABC-type bacteriocin/lantibiotic exporter with double-glycine peptidase domain
MVGFMGIAVAASLPLPWILKVVVDRVIPVGDRGLLYGLVGLSLGLTALAAAARVVHQYFQLRFRQAVSLSLRGEVLRHTLSLPPAFFDGEETGYLMSRASGDVMQVEILFTMFAVNLALDVIKLAGGVALLFFLHWKLALVSALFIPLYMVSTLLFRKPVRQSSNDLMEAWGAYFKSLQEVFSGVGLLKALARGRAEADRVMGRLEGSFPPERRSTWLSASSSALMGGVTSLGMAAVLAFGAVEIMEGRTTVGVLIAFLSYLGYLYGPARALAHLPVHIQPTLVALRRVLALTKVAAEPRDGIRPDRINGDLRLDAVTFAYDPGFPVLKDLSLAVRAGEKVGLAGKTGAGKSTVLKLLLGFHAPQAGQVTVDGIPVADFEPRALRVRLGYLSQEAFFFSDTVEGNLSWAAPGSGEEERRSALEAAAALEAVTGLPDGFATRIGEGGKKLSGGEKQRLAAARTLLLRPDLILMDEGTSDLDEATEARLLDGLLERFPGRTFVLVSHRPSALGKMDRVVFIEDGTVARDGPPAEVLGERGSPGVR